MIDRENVIKGIMVHTLPESKCEGCPYISYQRKCVTMLLMDALTLLKAKQPSDLEPMIQLFED